MPQTVLDFSTYIAERTYDFTGRDWILAEIERWLADPDAPSTFIITGDPGVGKSALAAHLVRSRTDLITAYHFCSARRGSWIDPVIFARSLARQLSLRFPEYAESLLRLERIHIEAQQTIGVLQTGGQAVNVFIETLQVAGGEDAFNRLVRDPLQQISAEGFRSPILILVDGLDESLAFGGQVTLVDVLSRVGDLPPSVRMILTSRDERRVLRYWDTIPHFRIDASGPQNMADIRAYVHMRLERILQSDQGITLSRLDFAETLSRVVTKSAGNFLYVSHLMDTFKDHPDTLNVLEDLPEGLDGVYRTFLNSRDIGKDLNRWDEYYLPVLGMLAVAREPLSEALISTLTGMDQQRVAIAVRDLWQYLSQEAGLEYRYRIYHQSFVDFLLDRERSRDHWIDARTWNRRLVTYYLRDPISQDPALSPRLDDYAFRHLSFHLAEAGLTVALFTLVENHAWRQRKLDMDPTGRGYATDIEVAIRAAAQSGVMGLPNQIAYSLLYAGSAEPAASAMREILVELVQIGRERQALDMAALMPNPVKEADACTAVGNALWSQGKQEEALTAWRRARDLAGIIGNPAGAAHTLTTLAAGLFQSKQMDEGRMTLHQAEEAIGRIGQESSRIEQWVNLAVALGAAEMMVETEAAMLQAITETEAIQHRFEQYGGGGHEDSPYDYYTGVWEKARAVGEISHALIRFRDQEWCERSLGRLDKMVDAVAWIFQNPPKNHSAYVRFSGSEEVGNMRSELAKVRQQLGGWRLRGLEELSEWNLRDVCAATDAIRQGDCPAALNALGPSLSRLVETVLRTALEAEATQQAMAFGHCLVEKVSDGAALARAAVVFARYNCHEMARALAERAVKVAQSEKPDSLALYMLDCAAALNLLGDASKGKRLVSQVEAAVQQVSVSSHDYRYLQYRYIPIAEAWKYLGENDQAARALYRAIPAGLSRDSTGSRDQALRDLATPAKMQAPSHPPRHEAWTPKNLATEALRYSLDGHLHVALEGILSGAPINECQSNIQILRQALSKRDYPEYVIKAVMLGLMAFGDYQPVLESIDRLTSNSDRALLLMICAKRLVADSEGTNQAVILEQMIACTQGMWAREDISRILGAVGIAFAALGNADRAWEVVQQIEYNDLRVDAVAAILRHWRETNHPQMIVENVEQVQIILDGLWAKIETVRGLVALASASAWAGDQLHTEKVLSHARRLAAQITHPQREKRLSLFPNPPLDTWNWTADPYVEPGLGDLATRGYAGDALDLAIRLVAVLDSTLALRLIGSAALTVGDSGTYQKVLVLANELAVKSEGVIPEFPSGASQELALTWVRTAFGAVPFPSQEAIWKHITAFAPILAVIDDGLPGQVLQSIKRVESSVVVQ